MKNSKLNNHIRTVGSICSGIEAASLAWKNLGFQFKWFSEIAPFPSKILREKFPNIPNMGNMLRLQGLISSEEIDSPDLLCAGTPCQAFSLAGLQNGLEDRRGNLTLEFINIANKNDEIRKKRLKDSSIIFWENVEGVLTDKTNAFGSFISLLAGLSTVLENKKWPLSGILRGPQRNIAWRVLDAKYFGLPQQRRRLYLVAGGKNFFPEQVLFEKLDSSTFKVPDFPESALFFRKENIDFEIFRSFTDCLYSAYGTKWNGNAAAYNGSLFVVQDNKIRRLSPLECERLMGFPDNYTSIAEAKKTNRYQAIGNSWAIPVVSWLGSRLINGFDKSILGNHRYKISSASKNYEYFEFRSNIISLSSEIVLNCTVSPEQFTFGKMIDILDINAPNDIFISPIGCHGIIRRKNERSIKINKRLENILLNTSSQLPIEDIERKSRLQKRGRYSLNYNLNFF